MILCRLLKRGPQRTIPDNHELALLSALLPAEFREGLNQILKTLDWHEAAHCSHHKRIWCDPQLCPQCRQGVPVVSQMLTRPISALSAASITALVNCLSKPFSVPFWDHHQKSLHPPIRCPARSGCGPSNRHARQQGL